MKTWYYADFKALKIEPVKISSFDRYTIRTENGFLKYRNNSSDAYCRTWNDAKNRIAKYWQDEANSEQAEIKCATVRYDNAMQNVEKAMSLQKKAKRET